LYGIYRNGKHLLLGVGIGGRRNSKSVFSTELVEMSSGCRMTSRARRSNQANLIVADAKCGNDDTSFAGRRL
jgi:hypothetical protein